MLKTLSSQRRFLEAQGEVALEERVAAKALAALDAVFEHIYADEIDESFDHISLAKLFGDHYSVSGNSEFLQQVAVSKDGESQTSNKAVGSVQGLVSAILDQTSKDHIAIRYKNFRDRLISLIQRSDTLKNASSGHSGLNDLRSDTGTEATGTTEEMRPDYYALLTSGQNSIIEADLKQIEDSFKLIQDVKKYPFTTPPEDKAAFDKQLADFEALVQIITRQGKFSLETSRYYESPPKTPNEFDQIQRQNRTVAMLARVFNKVVAELKAVEPKVAVLQYIEDFIRVPKTLDEFYAACVLYARDIKNEENFATNDKLLEAYRYLTTELVYKALTTDPSNEQLKLLFQLDPVEVMRWNRSVIKDMLLTGAFQLPKDAETSGTKTPLAQWFAGAVNGNETCRQVIAEIFPWLDAKEVEQCFPIPSDKIVDAAKISPEVAAEVIRRNKKELKQKSSKATVGTLFKTYPDSLQVHDALYQTGVGKSLPSKFEGGDAACQPALKRYRRSKRTNALRSYVFDLEIDSESRKANASYARVHHGKRFKLRKLNFVQRAAIVGPEPRGEKDKKVRSDMIQQFAPPKPKGRLSRVLRSNWMPWNWPAAVIRNVIGVTPKPSLNEETINDIVAARRELEQRLSFDKTTTQTYVEIGREVATQNNEAFAHEAIALAIANIASKNDEEDVYEYPSDAELETIEKATQDHNRQTKKRSLNNFIEYLEVIFKIKVTSEQIRFEHLETFETYFLTNVLRTNEKLAFPKAIRSAKPGAFIETFKQNIALEFIDLEVMLKALISGVNTAFHNTLLELESNLPLIVDVLSSSSSSEELKFHASKTIVKLTKLLQAANRYKIIPELTDEQIDLFVEVAKLSQSYELDQAILSSHHEGLRETYGKQVSISNVLKNASPEQVAELFLRAINDFRVSKGKKSDLLITILRDHSAKLAIITDERLRVKVENYLLAFTYNLSEDGNMLTLGLDIPVKSKKKIHGRPQKTRLYNVNVDVPFSQQLADALRRIFRIIQETDTYSRRYFPFVNRNEANTNFYDKALKYEEPFVVPAVEEKDVSPVENGDETKGKEPLNEDLIGKFVNAIKWAANAKNLAELLKKYGAPEIRTEIAKGIIDKKSLDADKLAKLTASDDYPEVNAFLVSLFSDEGFSLFELFKFAYVTSTDDTSAIVIAAKQELFTRYQKDASNFEMALASLKQKERLLAHFYVDYFCRMAGLEMKTKDTASPMETINGIDIEQAKEWIVTAIRNDDLEVVIRFLEQLSLEDPSPIKFNDILQNEDFAVLQQLMTKLTTTKVISPDVVVKFMNSPALLNIFKTAIKQDKSYIFTFLFKFAYMRDEKGNLYLRVGSEQSKLPFEHDFVEVLESLIKSFNENSYYVYDRTLHDAGLEFAKSNPQLAESFKMNIDRNLSDLSEPKTSEPGEDGSETHSASEGEDSAQFSSDNFTETEKPGTKNLGYF